MSSSDECKRLCKVDASCLAYSWSPSGGCRHTDYIDLDNNWEADVGAISGYLAENDRPDEYDCYTGRGEKYIGNLATTSTGTPCQDGSFCLNADGQAAVPRCKVNVATEPDNWENCNVVKCDEKWGKYTGNRGAQVQIIRKDLVNNLTPDQFKTAAIPERDQWINLNGEISPGKHEGYFDTNRLEKYSTKVRTNFIAPYDGVFSFFAGVDDRLRVTSDFDSTTGGYSKAITLTSWCRATESICKPGAITKRYDLKKGDKIELQGIGSETHGGDYISFGAQHFGLTGTGTWIDKRPKSEFPGQDAYIYGRQQLNGKKEHVHTYTWITLKYNAEFLANKDNLPNGETWTWRSNRGAIRIKLCGSTGGKKNNDNCFTTPDIYLDTHSQYDIRDMFKPFYETECASVTSSFSPLVYHGSYEDDSHWPGRHHFRYGRGAYCGRKAHKVNNHDIFNRHLGKAFDTNDSNDLCFAYKGRIDKIQFHAKFDYTTGDSKTATYHGWIQPEVNIKSTEYTWQCFEITDTIARLTTDISQLQSIVSNVRFYSISTIRLWNGESSPIYIDELHIGKNRNRNSNGPVQVRLPLSYDGQVPKRINVHKSRNGHGTHIALQVDTWDDISFCGYYVPLPTVLLPTDIDYVSSGDSESTPGSDWTKTDYNGLYDNWLDRLLPNAPKDFESMKLNLLQTSTNARNIYDVHVVRQSVIDQAFEADVVIKYGTDPTELKVRFDYDLWPLNLRQQIWDTWPALNDRGLNIYVWRSGWCNVGYTFTIQAMEHGKLDDFSMTLDADGQQNGRMTKPIYNTFLEQEASIHTHVLPGSVLATQHEVPQVVVVANGQRSACQDCDFVYKSSLSLEVVAVLDPVTRNPVTTVTAGEILIVEFDSNEYSGDYTDMVVTIEEVPCDIIQSARVPKMTYPL